MASRVPLVLLPALLCDAELYRAQTEALSDVVLRAMALPREERFGSMTELVTALHDPAPKRARRRRRFIFAAVLLLVLGGIGIAVLTHRPAGNAAKRVLIGEFVNRTGGPELAPVADIATDYIARGLAATRLLDEVFDSRAEPIDLKHGN